MEFTACGKTIGYVLVGSVGTRDLDKAYALVSQKVAYSLAGREGSDVEIILFDAGKELGRKSVTFGDKHGCDMCAGADSQP